MREVKVYILLLGLSFTAVCSQQDAKPPRILEGEQLLANGTVTLTCVGDEPLVWTYKYQDCQVEMRNQPRTLKTDDKYQSKLELNGINSQGHYHCHYENTSLSDPGASASTYVYLFSDEEDFAEPDLGPCQNHKETGHVGGQVVLDCRPTQPNLTVVVEHGGKEIHRGPLEDPRAGYELRNLTEDSKGQYKCYIFSGYIYKNGNKSIEVEVKGPLKPPRLNIAKNTFPVVGYDMKLFCQILDNKFQSQPTFTWTLPNGRKVEIAPEYHSVQSHMYYTSYLRVPNVTLEDSGTYSCTVNIEGRSPLPATRDINIKENEIPFLTVSTDTQNITCSTGEDVFWKLEVASFPPSFTLQSNSKIDHRQYPNGTCILEKKRATPSDFGEHTVTVTTNTSLGVKTEQVSLYLEVKSETELKITGINATTRPNATITLSCNAIGYPMENITWHYQSCPDGVCPESFREPEGSRITYAVHKENHHSSECTFVAKEFARIRCRSGKKEEFANIVVSEFAEPFSFKYNGTGGMKDLLTISGERRDLLSLCSVIKDSQRIPDVLKDTQAFFNEMKGPQIINDELKYVRRMSDEMEVLEIISDEIVLQTILDKTKDLQTVCSEVRVPQTIYEVKHLLTNCREVKDLLKNTEMKSLINIEMTYLKTIYEAKAMLTMCHEIKEMLTSHYTVKETDSFTLTCTASRFYFSNISLQFWARDKDVIMKDKVPGAYTQTDLDLISTFDVANASSRDQGHYKCTASPIRDYERSWVTLYLEVVTPAALKGTGNMMPINHEVVKVVKDPFTLDCSVSGTPIINIIWTKDDQPLPSNFGEFGEDNQTITITHLDPTIHSGHYECEARNKAGSVRGFLTLTVSDEGSSKTHEVIIGIITPFLICLLVVVLVLLRRVRQDFLKRREAKKNMALLFEKGRPDELNPDCTADEQAELLPYDHKWEVSRDQIQLGQQLGTGAFGRVVKATVSNLEPGISKTVVALKMCKMQADTTQIMSLIQELKIMIHIGKHLNIVNLMGSYTANVSKGELWILVEYCQYGSLLQFLHCHRLKFENVIDPITDLVNLSGRDGKESISPSSAVLKSPGSVNSFSDPQSLTHSESVQTASPAMHTGTRPCEISLESPASPKVLFSSSKTPNDDMRDGECQANPPRIFQTGDSRPSKMKMVQNPAVASTEALEEGSGDQHKKQQSLKVFGSRKNYFVYDKSTIPGVTSPFTTVDLICWSWQVAEGMDYLTHRKVLHGDLAARNLLLAEANVVKISDFGLSRDIYKDDIYLKQSGGLMPVKWMSIEAIRDNIFSVQSDIWSFGVTLWELFSLGSTPYPGVKIDRTFLPSLQDGYRMQKPVYANTDLHKIMCQCWESVPQDRPSFRHLADILSKMLMPETTQHYNIKNEEYLNMNKERFKHETDYLELLASPDITHIMKDGESKCEDGVRRTGKMNDDLQMHIESTPSDPDQGTGYLPTSSCTRSPKSSFDIFSPKRASANEYV